MKFRSKSWLLILLIVLISVSLSCNAISGGGQDSSPAPTNAVEDEPTLAPPPTEIPTEPPPAEPTQPPAEPTQAPTPTELSTPTEQEKPTEESAPPGDQNKLDTAFPLPDDVQNFMQLGDDIINFQTSLSLSEVVDFYRAAFSSQGLTERTLLTVISDMAVSLVFDGDPNGMAIVLQCVDLGDGTTNVNLSYQDL